MEFRIALPHGPRSGARARVAARAALTAWNVADPDGDVLIVASELAENVTRHTPDGGQLRLALFPGVLLVEVTDGSPDLPQLRDAGLAAPSGRGLQLVQAVAHRWGARLVPAGKVVWAEIALHPQLRPVAG